MQVRFYRDNRAKRGKRFFRLLVLTGIIVTAFITNPDKKAHIEKLNEEVYGLFPDNSKSSIIKELSGFVTNPVLEKLINYDNYYVFSVSKIKEEKIAYGVFGIVIFTKESNDIKDKIEGFL